MAKSEKSSKRSSKGKSEFPLIAPSKAIDPTLNSLFSSSLGPVKAPERCYTTLEPNSAAANDKRSNSNVGEDIDGEEVITSKKRKHDSGRKEENRSSRPENKKSRRRNEDDDKALEETYMRKIEEQAKKDLERQEQESKKLKLVAVDTPEGEDSQDEDRSADVENRATDGHEPDSESDSGSEDGDEDSAKPIRHETQDSAKSEELEKSARTIFLGNVPTSAITSKSDYKSLKSTFGAVGKISSVRFRSIAFSEQIPRKAAFLNQKFHDKQQTVNAYIVYKSKDAAREALKLNGAVILDRHIRVDSVAHPAQHDAKRCVFIGNLDFEAQEESLWRHFAASGKIESVRIVRDSKTNVGKGFAYVQFEDGNGVEKALTLDGQRMAKDRKLRVSRAKNIRRPKAKVPASRAPPSKKQKVFVPKEDPRRREMLGRAHKLLGKAGAAKMKKEPEVLEGMRATRSSESGVRLGGAGKRKGKPRARATTRSTAWKTKKG